MQLLSTKKRTSGLTAIATTTIILGVAFETFAADVTHQVVPEPTFDNSRLDPNPVDSKWGFVVGAGALYEPEYEGGSDFKVTPIPAVIITYDDWLMIDPRGLSLKVYDHEGFSLAGKIGFEVGRDEDDADRLNGLGDIDFAGTVGAKVAYQWDAMEIYAQVDQTIDGSESLIGNFGVEYSVAVTEKLFVGAGVAATVANEKHMDAYFGVSAAQSATSGLREYEAEAGVKRVDFTASATYMLTQNWLVQGEVGLGVLVGDAADSPIVEKELQPSVMAVIGYKF